MTTKKIRKWKRYVILNPETNSPLQIGRKRNDLKAASFFYSGEIIRVKIIEIND